MKINTGKTNQNSFSTLSEIKNNQNRGYIIYNQTTDKPTKQTTKSTSSRTYKQIASAVPKRPPAPLDRPIAIFKRRETTPDETLGYFYTLQETNKQSEIKYGALISTSQ